MYLKKKHLPSGRKEKNRCWADPFSRAYETAVLIFRAAVSLRLHKPMMNFLEILFSSYPISL